MAAPPGGGSGGGFHQRDIHSFTHSLRPCNTCHILKLALSHFRIARALRAQVLEQQKTIDRLEIVLRRQTIRIDELGQDLLHLSERVSGLQGRLSGGGAGRPRKANGQTQLSLESIPHGDKAALRAYFLKHPPKDDTEH